MKKKDIINSNKTLKDTDSHTSCSNLLEKVTLMGISAFVGLRCAGVRSAVFFYKSGGAGWNLYKNHQVKNKNRIFAIDCHPFTHKGEVRNLHYHRGPWFDGEGGSAIKKHRPFQGGY